jgi:hypothetical protein
MLLVIEHCPIHSYRRHADHSFTHKQLPLLQAMLLQPTSKKTQGKASPKQRHLRPNQLKHSISSRSRRALFLPTPNLVVPKKCPPGARTEQEGLHERSFGLDGVVQIVSGPGVQHLRQRDRTQRGMLFRPSQIDIGHLLEQDQAFLPSACERHHQLFGSQCRCARVRFVWIEIDELLSCQKSVEADRKNQVLSVQQML